MNQPQLFSLICGLLGGAVRAAVGITKYFQQYEGESRIQFGYLGCSLISAILAGGAAGLLAENDWRLALLFGYAGADLLENAYKIALKKQFFGPLLTDKIKID